jgi:hypothetical protein
LIDSSNIFQTNFDGEENDVEKNVLVCVCHEICNKLLVNFLQQLPFDIMELLLMTRP